MLHRSGFKRLTRLDDDEWVKDFDNERLAKQCVFEHLCEHCLDECDIVSTSKIEDMLSTACGTLFVYERIHVERFLRTAEVPLSGQNTIKIDGDGCLNT